MIRPNIIILGVGHSGTSVLARMLGGLGWDLNDADAGFAESVSARGVNAACVPTPFQDGKQWRGLFDFHAAADCVRQLREPWAIKDPRFVFTLHLWAGACSFIKPPEWKAPFPLLIQITKDLERVRQSYRKRKELLPNGEPGMYGHTVAELAELAQDQFTRWHGPKLQLDYSQLAAAVSLFSLARAA